MHGKFTFEHIVVIVCTTGLGIPFTGVSPAGTHLRPGRVTYDSARPGVEPWGQDFVAWKRSRLPAGSRNAQSRMP
jgi:hypothetical protein